MMQQDESLAIKFDLKLPAHRMRSLSSSSIGMQELSVCWCPTTQTHALQERKHGRIINAMMQKMIEMEQAMQC